MVIGTVIPKQKPWREKFTVLADAEKLQGEWESERLRLGAGMRLRATTLSQDVLRDAEAAWAVAKKRGCSSLLDAVLDMKRPQADLPNGAATGPKTYKQLFDEFMAYHKEHASKSQSDKVRQNAKAFGDYIGWETQIGEITIRDVQAWLKVRTHGFSKKTFNNILNDVSRVFSWACEPAQRFLTANPAAAINRYGAHVLAQGSREILTIEQCSRLMLFLEEHHPEWVFAFALMLFAGVRPGYLRKANSVTFRGNAAKSATNLGKRSKNKSAEAGLSDSNSINLAALLASFASVTTNVEVNVAETTPTSALYFRYFL